MKEKITFRSQTITPLFMSGINSYDLELRAPSIKGVMRFWWRAAQAEKDMDKLRKSEAEIFGGVGKNQGKSSFSIRTGGFDILNKVKYRMLPHHTGRNDCSYCIRSNNSKPCISSKGRMADAVGNQSFNVILSYDNLPDSFPPDKLKALFVLCSLTGGLGKRSRRGFGSFKITTVDDVEQNEEINLNSILHLLEVLAPQNFIIQNNKIVLANTFIGQYSYIQEIELGREYNNMDDLLRTISASSSNNSCDYTGFAGGGARMASPVYVSVIPFGNNYKPVITTLHAAFENNRGKGKNLQAEFKRDIMV